MKKLTALFVLVIGFATSGIAEEDAPTEGVLYLHCFRSSQGLRPNPHITPKYAIPVHRLLSMRFVIGQPFDLSISPHSKGISGVIRPNEKAFSVNLTGQFGTSSHHFEGKVKIDEIFDPALQGFSGAVNPFRCVISRSKDITPFIEAQTKLDDDRKRKSTN